MEAMIQNSKFEELQKNLGNKERASKETRARHNELGVKLAEIRGNLPGLKTAVKDAERRKVKLFVADPCAARRPGGDRRSGVPQADLRAVDARQAYPSIERGDRFAVDQLVGSHGEVVAACAFVGGIDAVQAVTLVAE